MNRHKPEVDRREKIAGEIAPLLIAPHQITTTLCVYVYGSCGHFFAREQVVVITCSVCLGFCDLHLCVPCSCTVCMCWCLKWSESAQCELCLSARQFISKCAAIPEIFASLHLLTYTHTFTHPHVWVNM